MTNTILIDYKKVDRLIAELEKGTPLASALSISQISKSTYYYWVALASIAKKCQEEREIKELEKLIQSGVDMEEIRMNVERQSAKCNKSSINNFIEPTGESIMRYKKSKPFKRYVDEVYENIILKCDEARSTFVSKTLADLVESGKDKKSNGFVYQWLLEKSMPEVYGKTYAADSENANDNNGSSIGNQKRIVVEYVNPDTNVQKDRIRELEKEVLNNNKYDA